MAIWPGFFLGELWGRYDCWKNPVIWRSFNMCCSPAVKFSKQVTCGKPAAASISPKPGLAYPALRLAMDLGLNTFNLVNFSRISSGRA